MGIVRDLYMARKIGAGTKLPAPTVASLVKRLMLASIIGGPGEKKTVSGDAPLTLKLALEHDIKSLTQYGLCTQADTPTPDAPVDIMCNNGALKWDSVNQRVYADGTPEVLKVSASGHADQTASVVSLLSVGDYKDEHEIISGSVKRKCAACVYDGTQVIGDVYMSETGGKDVGAIIVYPVAETTDSVAAQPLTTSDGTNTVSVTAEVSPISLKAVYMKERGVLKTASGALVHITDALAKAANDVTASIKPIQSFNGYGKPWPAGGGENKFEPIEGADNTISFVAQPDGSVKISGTGYTTKWTGRSVTYDLPYHGINAGDTVTIWSDIFFVATPYNGNTSLGQKTSANGVATTFTIPANANKLRLGENAKAGQVQKGEVIDVIGHFFIGKVDSFSSWSPYSNICPLIGLTGLSAYVSPTADIADATTYSVDWTADAGTVYGGSYEAVSGELKTRPYIASYNGETLVGPWISSHDEYVEGATPTTGAQVVDLGGSETSYQLTAQEVQMLLGENYVWSSSGDDVSVTYVADGTANNRQALRILLGDSYSNQGTTDDVSDKEALDIILGGNK